MPPTSQVEPASPSSTGASEAAQAPCPSGGSGSPTFVAKLAKVGLADHLRLLADNQRLLDRTAAGAQATQQQGLRLREAQMQQVAGNPAQAPVQPSGEAMGDINIDSPTTVNNNYPAPPAPTRPNGSTPAPSPAAVAAPSLLSRLLPWAAALGLGAGGLFAGKALSGSAPSAQPVAPTTTIQKSASGFTLELVEPKK